MKKFLLLITFLTLLISVQAQVQNNPSVKNRNAIIQVMNDQQIAWNRGDINAFMEGYWKSDQLVFVSGGGMLYGWKVTKDNYHERYPTREAMGTLVFDLREISQIDRATIRVIGTFHLERTIGNMEGYFTLIFKRINDRWLIISDHTSVSE